MRLIYCLYTATIQIGQILDKRTKTKQFIIAVFMSFVSGCVMFIVSQLTAPNRYHNFILTFGEKLTTAFLLPTLLGLVTWIIMILVSLVTKKRSKYYVFVAYFTSASFLYSVFLGYLLYEEKSF